jgi:hypothetical protein
MTGNGGMRYPSDRDKFDINWRSRSTLGFDLVLFCFKPGSDGFACIGESLITRFSLGPATTKGGNVCNEAGIFAGLEDYLKGHVNLLGE